MLLSVKNCESKVSIFCLVVSGICSEIAVQSKNKLQRSTYIAGGKERLVWQTELL